MYRGVVDMFNAANPDLAHTGRFTVVPPSVTGSPRYMRKLYQDAMAIVRALGTPHAFVTVTCNPEWPEIRREIGPDVNPSDRPDVVARIFKQKLKAILDDLLHKYCFGEVLAHMYVIEYQKRGLPHAHILLIFTADAAPRTNFDYDQFTSADIPDPELNQGLYATVTRCMLHGPCGEGFPNAKCVDEHGRCTKKYPKTFRNETKVEQESVKYRRRNNMRQFGRTVTGRGGRRTFVFDNRWVVPYNPYISAKYDCHINVEVIVRERAVKYIYKYIYKGPDRITQSVDRFDEISQYVNSMYLCPVEAVWKLMEFEMQGRSHTVVQLAIHLPDEQIVQYGERDNAETIEERRHKTLTRFFETCANDPAARELLYSQFPQQYVWERRHWRPRQRGGDKALGRMISVPPRDSERFYIRLLLCYRKGPTSFEDLRGVGNLLYDTYAEAALAAGYVEDENECDNCLSEAVTYQMPRELRRLFAMLLVHCTPANPRQLWDKYLEHLADGLGDPTEGRVLLRLLSELEQYLAGSGKALSNFLTPPQLADYYQCAHEPAASPGEYMRNLLLEQEEAFDDSTLDSVIHQAEKFNCEQRIVYEAVVSGVRDPSAQGRLIFLDGPGGRGSLLSWRRFLRRCAGRRRSRLP